MNGDSRDDADYDAGEASGNLATRLHDCPISNSPFAGRPSGPYSHLTSNWSTALPSPDSDEAALFYLLDLATFFDMARAGRWQAAIQHMDQLGLLPSTTIESTSSSPGLGVDQCVALFSRLSDCVRRPLAATAILCLMRCLVASANSLILGPGLGHDSSEIL
ncbi:unnamed protein product [Protopolystoma xenopodis]|uniref:Uncharacterized protein n=1 Tax=Protopolystoma xenopodis TaxID=117903 RepID=A0A3S5ABT8_9PLAT|nr:unnamed protein product [Protopolystoma xenopodis]